MIKLTSQASDKPIWVNEDNIAFMERSRTGGCFIQFIDNTLWLDVIEQVMVVSRLVEQKHMEKV